MPDLSASIVDIPCTCVIIIVTGFIDTLTLSIPDRSIASVSNDGANAKVHLTGTLVIAADQDAAEASLSALVSDGRAVRVALGSDALWIRT